MGLVEILSLLSYGSKLAETLFREKRDPTALEIADLKSRMKAAEDRWGSLAPKPPGGN